MQMKYVICAECGLVAEAELKRNDLVMVGLYHHCGWVHYCAKEDLFDSKLAALSAATQLAKKEPCK